MYIRITEDGDKQYPYDLASLRADFPNTSFPEDPSLSTLAEFGVFQVSPASTYPVCGIDEVVVEDTPVANDSGYEQYFTVRKLSEEEVAASKASALTAAKVTRAEAVRNIVVTTSSGKSFDGDEDAQNRMARSIQLLTDSDELPWVLADSTVAPVTKAELTEALRLSGLAMAQIWVSIYN